jgi:hypothetical protein
MKDYSIYVISNKPHIFPEIQQSLCPEPVTYFDGTGVPSFAKLVNSCVLAAPTEIVIILSDKVRPKPEEIFKMVDLIKKGIGFVAFYRFAFFGFKKELMRRIGVLDEGFQRGGFEDDDFYLRLHEADIGMYVTEEAEYIPSGSSWDYSLAKQYFISKWVDTTWEHYNPEGKVSNNIIKRKLDEPNYNYDFGPSVPTEFKNWNYTVVHTFKARKFVRPPRKYKRIHIA